MTSTNYKWTPMGKPTMYPIYDNGKLAIPKGATGIEIAFGQSSRHLLKNGKPTGKMQNVYRWHDKIYNA